MEIKTEKLNIRTLLSWCPAAHLVAAVSLALIAAHVLMRPYRAVTAALSQSVVRPLHTALSTACSKLNFSVAELLIGIFSAAVVVYIIYSIVSLICRPHTLRRVYIMLMTLLAAGLAIYAGFCLMWGVYFYSEDFEAKSGLSSEEVSLEQLAAVTEYFARLSGEYGELVPRGADGCYIADRAAILERSDEVFVNAERLFPCLEGPELRAKGIYFSRLMSYTDFTGFFFPFTAEANVNTDFPPALFASTVAHELAHQRGVAKEQEANFVSVLACLEYADAEYCYSACMLAYTHLSNALYEADREAWQEVYETLSPGVLADFKQGREYWRQFETPVQTVSNKTYETFLYSYDQTLGLKSYGACVDLLVNYYYPAAAQ